VRLAARGTRNMDRGEERIGDTALVERLRSQGRKVTVQSALVAVLPTAVSLML